MESVFEVDMRKKQAISIGARGLRGLEQEIRTVLSTRKGSVPLDRDFGLAWDYVDLPVPEAMPYLVAEIGMKLEKYVPRIRVREITFSSSDPVDGVLQPCVTVEIKDEYRQELLQESA